MVKRFFIKLGFSIIEGYGLSETSPVVTFNASINRYLDAVGQPLPDIEIKIDQPDVNATGEVLIKGLNVMKGYYQMPDETQLVIKDGWFYSGDLGRINSDGYLFLTGRKNELIVLSSRKNISPEELENYYLKSPFFKELCILDVRDQGQEKLMAVVVPSFDYLQEHRATNIRGSIRFAIDNLSKDLPSYKHVMGFVLTKEELPRTRLGKLKRFEIREKYWDALTNRKPETTQNIENNYTEEDQIIIASPLFQKIARIIHQQKPSDKPIQLSDHLEIDLGFDSLGRVELLSKLEEGFHVRLNNNVMEKIFSVKDLVRETGRVLQQQDRHFTASPKSWHELLSAKVDPSFLEKIDLSPNEYRITLLKGIHYFLHALLRLFWKIQIFGVENLPQTSPCIICANHVSYLDAPILGSSLPFSVLKHTYFLGFAQYFESSFLKYSTKTCKVIPINAGTRLIDALQVAAYILKNNNSICIFPEGERSFDGSVKEFKKSIGHLAKELNLPLLPVYIDGTFEAWPRTQTLPKCRPIKVAFGIPHSPEELLAMGKKLNPQDDYEAIALAIREKVIQLKSLIPK